MTLHLGIDIGVQGAIAIVDQSGALLEVHDTPVLKDEPAGRRARQPTAQPGPVGYGPTFVTRYETQDPLTYDFRPGCAVGSIALFNFPTNSANRSAATNTLLICALLIRSIVRASTPSRTLRIVGESRQEQSFADPQSNRRNRPLCGSSAQSSR
jgi:hypothetical protein